MKEKKRNTKITSREKKIIRLIALGYTDAEIAETIKLSYSTIRLCLRQLLLKTATVNRANLINWAYQEKIL